MKSKNLLFVLFILILVLSSCQGGRKVMGSSSFQKRKYNKGWYVEKSGRPDNPKKQDVIEIPKEAKCDSYCEIDQVEQEPNVIPNTVIEDTIQATALVPFIATVKETSNLKEHQLASPEKKKRKKSKAAVIPIIEWGALTSSFSTWFWGWQNLAFLNIPVLGIILGSIGFSCCIIGLFKLKKVKKKGRNILMAVFGILYGLLSLLVCIMLL